MLHTPTVMFKMDIMQIKNVKPVKAPIANLQIVFVLLKNFDDSVN